MSTTTPNFLLMDTTGILHAYWNLDIMLIDIAGQRLTPPKALYRLDPGGLTTKYVPVTEHELRQAKDRGAS